jgi:hypothetical protein
MIDKKTKTGIKSSITNQNCQEKSINKKDIKNKSYRDCQLGNKCILKNSR